MPVMRNFHVVLLLYLVCCSHLNSAQDLISIQNYTFVKSSDFFVNIFQEDVFESKLFELDYSSFKMPTPESIANMNDTVIQTRIMQFAAPILEQKNAKIMSKLQKVCINEDSGATERVKRAIVLIVSGFVVVALLMSYVIYQGFQIKNLKNELKLVESNLNIVAESMSNLTRAVQLDGYLNQLKSTVMEYANSFESLVSEFIDLLFTGQTFKLSSLPSTLLSHFSSFGVNSSSENFFYLKMAECKTNSIVIEVKSVQAEVIDQVICHKYEHMGVFEANLYNRFEMNSLICYNNSSCIELNTKECIGTFNQFNCTSKALSPCKCHPDNVKSCRIISEFAPKNFVHVVNRPEFVAVATNAETYTVHQNGSSTTKTAPSNHIFGLILNKNDEIEIGGIVVKGKSKKPTYIPHIVIDDFTLPPFPPTETPYHFDYEGLKKVYFFEILLGVCVFGFVVYIVIKNCF